MGVPLFVHDIAQGVIAPVPGRVTSAVRGRLRGLTVFVSCEDERDRLVRVCVPGQRFVLFDVAAEDPGVGTSPGAEP